MDNDKKNWSKVRDMLNTKAPLQLGRYYSFMIEFDAKHLLFLLSRYKFASKLLAYRDSVRLCELGCQEAIGALLLAQNVKLSKYVGVDLDSESINWNKTSPLFNTPDGGGVVVQVY